MNEHFHDPITYISDCRDENTRGRLQARLSTYFPGSNLIFVGVPTDYEAAINLVDIIDAYDGAPGVVLVNVARRDGDAKKWPNGTPFGWFKIDKLNIFTTIDGFCLSLIQKLRGKNITVDVYDIPTVVPHMNVDEETQERIIDTQFRSFDYLPRLAAGLVGGEDYPRTTKWDEVPLMPEAFCWIDSFGNLKTNVLPEEINFKVGRDVIIRTDKHQQFRFTCYNRLPDIPDNEIGFTIGSSGMGQKRFVEVMLQGGNAAKTLNLESGTKFEYIGSV